MTDDYIIDTIAYIDVIVFDRYKATRDIIRSEEFAMNHSDFTEQLKDLGFPIDTEKNRRLLSLIGIMLILQSNTPRALRFGEIYNAAQSSGVLGKVTRAKIHRYLKELIRLEFVHLEKTQGSRRQYIISPNTITDGVEKARNEVLRLLTQQLEEIKNKIMVLEKVDCSKLAEKIVYSLTGKRATITTRFAKGVEGMHNLLLNNILAPAGEGDIIRASAMFVTTLMEGGVRRTQKFLDAVGRGAIVKYMIPSEVFTLINRLKHSKEAEGLMGLVRTIFAINREGSGVFEVRVRTGPKTYNHISLNNERAALILTESPITTTLVTREFNADLIDNIVRDFDESWEKAIPLEDAVDKIADEIDSDNPLRVAILRAMGRGDDR